MKQLGKYIAGNKFLKEILLSSSLVKKIAGRFVLGEHLEEISCSLEDWNKEGFGAILYPIEADSKKYIDCLRFLSDRGITGSVSLRTPLDGLDSVVAEARKTGLRLEFDMRSPKTVDQTLHLYSKVKNEHGDSVICLQANLYRTIDDIKRITHLSPIVRLVKGAFDGEGAYKSKRDVDINFIQLAEDLMDRDIKVYFATHDEEIVEKLIESANVRGIEKRQIGFQMLFGVKQNLQDSLHNEGFEVWKYAAYGEDWVPYCVNRLFERRENFKYALDSLLRRG